MSHDFIHRPPFSLVPLSLNITSVTVRSDGPIALTVLESAGEQRDHGMVDGTGDAF